MRGGDKAAFERIANRFSWRRSCEREEQQRGLGRGSERAGELTQEGESLA